MGSRKLTCDKVAVVTGANRGIGLEVVRQLARQGVTVVLTARDERRGMEAVASLQELESVDVIFHQCDVRDPVSIAALARFLEIQFGKLDILVNNAGHSGVTVDVEGLHALNIDPVSWLSGKAAKEVQSVIKTTYEMAESCLDVNYYGCKRMVDALLTLLQWSTSGARIVNVSSLRGELTRVPNEEIRTMMGNVDDLKEEIIDEVVQKFMKDLMSGSLEANGWPLMLPAYSVSKLALNAYTRVIAKKFPKMYINCVHPGYVDTAMNWHTGTMTVEEGAKGPVLLALLPDGCPNGCPTGCYFSETQLSEF